MTKTLYSSRYRGLIGLLRKLRQDRRFRQADLAAQLGYSQALVSNVERYERRLDVDELLNWLEALQVDPAEFFAELEKDRGGGISQLRGTSRVRKHGVASASDIAKAMELLRDD